MKLLNKTSLYNFFLSLFVITIGLCVFYVVLQKFVSEDATENLYIKRQRIKQELPLIDSVPDNSRVLNSDIRFIRLPDNTRVKEILKDTLIFETYDRDYVPYRVLTTNVQTKLYNYEVIIYQSMIESDDLIHRIAKALVYLVISYLLLLVLVNRVVFGRIWQPFYETLNELKSFDIQRSERVGHRGTSIDEFNALNEALSQMTEKIKNDYRNLKEFTENASHEIQTPLAIVQNKIELMLQSENVSEAEWKNLNSINEAATRLSKLNQSLLLLSKIENGQFKQAEAVDLSLALERHLDNLSELISTKGIKLYTDIEPGVMVFVHPYLLNILLGNVLMNAIRHNLAQGTINARLSKGLLFIQNSGEVLDIDPKNLFSRFKKGNSDGDSIGIGLSLVQKIAESNAMEVKYTYKDKIHTLEFRF